MYSQSLRKFTKRILSELFIEKWRMTRKIWICCLLRQSLHQSDAIPELSKPSAENVKLYNNGCFLSSVGCTCLTQEGTLEFKVHLSVLCVRIPPLNSQTVFSFFLTCGRLQHLHTSKQVSKCVSMFHDSDKWTGISELPGNLDLVLVFSGAPMLHQWVYQVQFITSGFLCAAHLSSSVKSIALLCLTAGVVRSTQIKICLKTSDSLTAGSVTKTSWDPDSLCHEGLMVLLSALVFDWTWASEQFWLTLIWVTEFEIYTTKDKGTCRQAAAEKAESKSVNIHLKSECTPQPTGQHGEKTPSRFVFLQRSKLSNRKSPWCLWDGSKLTLRWTLTFFWPFLKSWKFSTLTYLRIRCTDTERK